MKEYDEKAPSKYIMYLDANNLYGWAMSQYLPTGNFKWMTDKEINKVDLGKYKGDGKKGLILEVDLEYPQELHDIHNDYPVTPEKVKVSNNMVVGWCIGLTQCRTATEVKHGRARSGVGWVTAQVINQ